MNHFIPSRWKLEQEAQDEKNEAIALLVLMALVLVGAILIANHYGWTLY